MTDERPVQVDVGLLRQWRLPDPGGDKSHRGTVLVVGGSRQTPGAVLLAAEAALRVGAGKVQVATAADTAAAVGVALPEAFVEGLPVLHDGELAVAGADRVLELASAADVVLLGPGLGRPQSASLFAERIIPRLDTELLLDALGTAYLTGRLDGVRHLAGRVVLTPNVTELAAVLERSEEDVSDDPLEAVRTLADRADAVVLGGGEVAYVVRAHGACWSCDSGPSSLATAGSGDVKAGAAAGLLARGATPEQAAVWAAWLHAGAGASLQDEQPGYLAHDVVRAVPAVLDRFERGHG